jgi:hypothetical protein
MRMPEIKWNCPFCLEEDVRMSEESMKTPMKFLRCCFCKSWFVCYKKDKAMRSATEQEVKAFFEGVLKWS